MTAVARAAAQPLPRRPPHGVPSPVLPFLSNYAGLLSHPRSEGIVGDADVVDGHHEAAEYHAEFATYEGKFGEIPLGHYCRQSLVPHMDTDALVKLTREGF